MSTKPPSEEDLKKVIRARSLDAHRITAGQMDDLDLAGFLAVIRWWWAEEWARPILTIYNDEAKRRLGV